MPPREDGPAASPTALYFSFRDAHTAASATLFPTHPLTRGLTNLETVVGQLFPATLIARMVTLELTSRHGAAGVDPAR